MPVINGVYLKDFTALPGAVADADIIPIAITGNQIAYRTTVAGIVTDARITAKLLTGLSVTGGAVVAADTILAAFGKVQNQINGKQGTITLTTTGTSGAATFVSDTLNIPNYGSALTGYVPYTGATQDVDLGAFKLNAQSFHVKGTAGNGHLGLKHQSSAATASANESSLFADSNGDMSFQNANLYLNKFVTSANSANRTYTFPDATGTVALVGGSGVGTVTSVAALTLGTTGTDLSSTVATGTTTPVITLQVPTASASNRGALSSADWTTFNNKAAALSGTINTIAYWDSSTTIASLALATYPSLTELSYVKGVTSAIQTQLNAKQATITLTTTGTSGAATFSANTLNIPQYQAAGTYVTSVTGTSPIVSSGGTTPAISIPVATTLVNGYLSSTDWTTFNGKQATITLTTTGTSGAATFSSNTLNIPNYADGGVLSLSAIGGTANANAATITGTVLNLQPASASFGGVVTTGTQTFAGSKTFNNDIYVIGGAQVYGLSAIGEYDGGAQIPPAYGGNYALTLGSGLTANGLSLYATGAALLTSTATATAFIPSGATVPTNGMYLSAANTLDFATNTTNRLTITSVGYVGIGTTSPLNIFDVKGAIFTGSYASSAGVRFHDNVYGINLGGIDASSIGVIQGSAFEVGAANIALQPNGGNVGIGTTSPNAKLEVVGTAGLQTDGNQQLTITAPTTTVAHGAGLRLNAASGAKEAVGIVGIVNEASGNFGSLVFHTYAGGANVPERMRITSGGEVYIAGTTDQGAYNLQCNGTGVWGAGAYVNGSDLRLKEDIKPILSGLDYVNKMNPVSFKYLESYSRDRSIQTGFIAQELIEVFKDEEWVDGIVKQGTEHYNVAYQAIIPVLVKAIQELKAEIDILKNN